MSVKSRLQRAEQAAGAGEDDPIVIIVRWGDDETALQDMPHWVSADGKVHRYGINTIPEHLRNLQLAWPEDE